MAPALPVVRKLALDLSGVAGFAILDDESQGGSAPLGALGGVTDQGDGTYTATFTAGTVIGTAVITGTLNGATIADSAIITLEATPFEVSALLASLGLAGRDAVADGVLRFVVSATGTAVMLDVDGNAGPASPRLLVTLRDVTPTQLRAGRDY